MKGLSDMMSSESEDSDDYESEESEGGGKAAAQAVLDAIKADDAEALMTALRMCGVDV